MVSKYHVTEASTTCHTLRLLIQTFTINPVYSIFLLSFSLTSILKDARNHLKHF